MNELLTQAETLQNLLVSHATGSRESDVEYRQLRQVFLSDSRLATLLPKFVHAGRSLSQFWGFIKYEFDTYAERRNFIWAEFQPLMGALEHGLGQPVDAGVSDLLEEFDAANIHAAWSKALDRRDTDPEAAITSARTLLESVCKHILDDLSVSYDDAADLPKLYRLTSEALTIAPSQHTEQIFKQILVGCTAVVEGLGAMRNRLSDAHGKGKRPVKPAPRHAELAVNLAGATAQFLVATWRARTESPA